MHVKSNKILDRDFMSVRCGDNEQEDNSYVFLNQIELFGLSNEMKM